MVDLLSRPLVPVASEADADATLDALLPRLDADATIVVCHVIEKAGGAVDKASVDHRKVRAHDIFDVVETRCRTLDVTVETRVDYGTDVAETVFAAAADVDATAVVFTPREGSRWLQFLTGDTTLDLVTENDRPVVVLPDTTDDDGADDAEAAATAATDPGSNATTTDSASDATPESDGSGEDG
jgi:nucleotide-binding universal stress UspA family protein